MSGYTGDSSYPHHPAPNTGQRNQQQAQQQHPLVPYFDQPIAQHHLQQPPQPQSHLQPQQQASSYEQQSPQYEQIGHNGHGNEHTGEVYQASTPPKSLKKGGNILRPSRLHKACDSCSLRKVKCDDTGPPCKPCAALDIPCTTSRPSKRRGPPNRHAEQIREEIEAKKRKVIDAGGDLGNYSIPISPHDVAATLASFSTQGPAGAEAICPIPIIQLLIDDFFTYIHPLAPFPHEPSFRDAFMAREDLHNKNFLALLASMVGVLVASFPRKPILHLKSHHSEHLFPSSLSLVEQCHNVATTARGSGYLDKNLSVYDAVTSYFLGLAAAYTHEWKRCRLYFGETLNISRVLGVHKAKDAGLLSVGALPATFGGEGGGLVGQAEPVDYIKQEIGRRVFWVMVVGVRSLQQLGASFGELFIPPPTPGNPYPPYPAEVDDEFILIDRIGSQPPGVISKLKGFNVGIGIYMSLSPLATLEMAYGIDEVFDWNRQKKVLEDCLNTVKSVLNDLPPELQLRPSSQPGQFESTDRLYYPPMTNYSSFQGNGNEMPQWSQEIENRRKLQFEIQKANIYASQLGTRSYIVEKYGNLQAAHNRTQANSRGKSSASTYDDIETNVANEREDIIKDLLRVLRSISQVNMEPNGASFINKIRQIASTLIDQPQDRKGPLAVKHEQYLAKFLDILMKLERISPSGKNDMGDIIDDEEEELRSWADLRDYQHKFAQSGGFLNENL